MLFWCNFKNNRKNFPVFFKNTWCFLMVLRCHSWWHLFDVNLMSFWCYFDVTDDSFLMLFWFFFDAFLKHFFPSDSPPSYYAMQHRTYYYPNERLKFIFLSKFYDMHFFLNTIKSGVTSRKMFQKSIKKESKLHQKRISSDIKIASKWHQIDIK